MEEFGRKKKTTTSYNTTAGMPCGKTEENAGIATSSKGRGKRGNDVKTQLLAGKVGPGIRQNAG